MGHFFKLLILALVLGVAVVAQGQTCDAIVDDALDAMGRNCDAMDRNSACYGYNNVSARFTRIVERDFFSRPTDRAALQDIRTITTAPFSLTNNTWGVAVMNLQADVPDTLPGQAVTFVLIGDATVEEAADPDRPAPMQAFYFSTGVGTPQCREAPDVLVVQSPQGATVNLRANGADIQMGSTIVLRTLNNPPRMQLLGIEGEIVINPTNEDTDTLRQRVPPFFIVEVPLSELRPLGLDGDEPNREVIGPWSSPRRVTLEELEILRRLQLIPLNILPEGFVLPETLPEGCSLNPDYDYLYFAQEGDTLSGIASRFGVNVFDLINGNCLRNPDVVFVGQVILVPFSFTSDVAMGDGVGEPEPPPDDPPPPPPPPPGDVDIGVTISTPNAPGGNVIANLLTDLQITVTNTGPMAANNVVINNNFASVLTPAVAPPFANLVLAAAPPVGLYNAGTGDWLIPTLNPGDVYTLEFTATARPGYIGNSYNIVAQKTAVDEVDTNIANDSSTQAITFLSSIIYVNNLTMVINANDGACTLVEAIIAAQTNTASGNAIGECEAGVGTNNTIEFINGGALTILTADYGVNAFPPITETITITTLSGTNVTFQSLGAFRFFEVMGSGSLTLAPSAGDTFAFDNGGGAGINGGSFFNAGTLALAGNVVVGNSTGDDGGAIYNTGTVNTSGSVSFSNGDADQGGAIYNTGTLNLQNTQLSENEANADGGAIYNTAGGAVNIGAGVIFADNDTIGSGGAIHNEGPSIINIVGSAGFSNNTALWGGAIMSSSFSGPAQININSASTFSGNSTTGSGGAIYNGNDSSLTITGAADFVNNSTPVNGGAIYHEGNNLNITAPATFTNNTANSGGAIASDANMLIDAAVVFTGNQALGTGFGGGGAIRSTFAANIDGASFNNNTAANTGGGGAIQNVSASLTLANATFNGNSATNGGAAVAHDTFASSTNINNSVFENHGLGAVLLNQSANPLTVSNSTFTNNTATPFSVLANTVAGGSTTFTNVTLGATNAAANCQTTHVVTDGGGNTGGDGTCFAIVGTDVDVAVTINILGPNTTTANETKTVRIQVSNLGPDTATNVVVTDNVNAVLGTAFTNITPVTPIATGTYDLLTGTWNIPSIANGDSYTLHIDVDTRPGYPNTIYNPNAAVTSVTENDTNPLNDSDTASLSILPSAPFVNSLSTVVADDGFCTLPEAIMAAQLDAPSGNSIGECEAGVGVATIIQIGVTGQIQVNAAPYTDPLGGENAFPIITQNITITTTAGDIELTRSAAFIMRHFFVDTGGTLILSPGTGNITVSFGNAQGLDTILGGAIYNRGSLNTQVNTFFNNNAATGGGVIYNLGTANIDQTIFNNNFATNNPGGVLYNGGTGFLSVVSSVFNNGDASIYGGSVITHESTSVTEIATSQVNTQVGTVFNNYGTGAFNIINGTLDPSNATQIVTTAGANMTMTDMQINSGAFPQCDPAGAIINGGGNGGGDGTCFP